MIERALGRWFEREATAVLDHYDIPGPAALLDARHAGVDSLPPIGAAALPAKTTLRIFRHGFGLHRAMLAAGVTQDVADRVIQDIMWSLFSPSVRACYAATRLVSRDPRRRAQLANRVAWSTVFRVGWEHEMRPDRGDVAMDVTACAFADYFTRAGIPEFTGVVACSFDGRMAAALQTELTRTTTIAAGHDRCDFTFTVTPVDLTATSAVLATETSTRPPRTRPEQLAKARVRSWLEAKVLTAADKMMRKLHGPTKQEAIGAMGGTVVEIGPGTGVNMAHYPPGVRVIAVEPNVNMHPELRAAAAAHGVDLEIRTLRGEQIDLDDAVADGVVGTLVLCGVDDPEAVVAEVRRVLKPGGTYFFLEHVASPPRTATRRLQDALFRAHRWAANGCETNRDTASVIEAAGFESIAMREIDPGWTAGYTRPHLVGTAVN